MNDLQKQPVDPFSASDLDLEIFKKQENQPITAFPPDKAEIRKIAEQSDFQSRQPIKRKQKATAKSFSLFPDDLEHINRAFNEMLKSYLENPEAGLAKPSDSDVVRAALHLLALQPIEEQLQLIKEHRGRGRM